MTAVYQIPSYTIDDLNALRPLKALVEVRPDGTTLDGVTARVVESGDYLIEYSLSVALDKADRKTINAVRSSLYAGGLQVSLDQTPLSLDQVFTNYELGGFQVVSLPANGAVDVLVGKVVSQGGTHRVHGGTLKITKL